MSEVKIVSLKPIGYFASGEPRYEFDTSFPTKNVRPLGRPMATPDEAFEVGRKYIESWEHDTFPGGMGQAIGVVALPDGKFDAVINTYYSFS
jgi:hypothetical protein